MSQMNGLSQWNYALDLGMSLIRIWMYAQAFKIEFLEVDNVGRII
jgi:hypothetical protein